MKTLKEIRVIAILDDINNEMERIAGIMKGLAEAATRMDIRPKQAMKVFKGLADRAIVLGERHDCLMSKYKKDFSLINGFFKQQELAISRCRYFFEY